MGAGDRLDGFPRYQYAFGHERPGSGAAESLAQARRQPERHRRDVLRPGLRSLAVDGQHQQSQQSPASGIHRKERGIAEAVSFEDGRARHDARRSRFLRFRSQGIRPESQRPRYPQERRLGGLQGRPEILVAFPENGGFQRDRDRHGQGIHELLRTAEIFPGGQLQRAGGANNRGQKRRPQGIRQEKL